MKRTLLFAVTMMVMASCATAQNTWQLPEPDLNVSMTLTQALKQRHSSREFSEQKLSDATLSIVLWGANGINRPDRKLLTAPTATNAQDISIYVCREDGAWLWDAVTNSLTRVCSQDVRGPLAGPQESTKKAPIFLLLVSDYSKFRGNAEMWGPMDAGYVSQNIGLICEALGLNSVARGMMDKETVAKALGLNPNQHIMLNHPIGYPVKK